MDLHEIAVRMAQTLLLDPKNSESTFGQIAQDAYDMAEALKIEREHREARQKSEQK